MTQPGQSTKTFRVILHLISNPGYQRVFLLILLALALIALTWSSSDNTILAAGGLIQATVPAGATQEIGPTLNPEYVANRSQTDGIIVGATILVLIILIGTLLFTRQKENQY